MSGRQRSSSAASATASLPTYSAVIATAIVGTALPPYTGTSYCRIGGKAVPTPFITLDQLRAHLRLLHAIKEFKTAVEDGTDERYSEYVRSLEPSQRWVWTVSLAVDRFTKWIQTVQQQMDRQMWVQEHMPPLDVLMVWHTYLLNPQWYAEDCDRLVVLAKLKTVNDHLLGALTSVGDITDYTASETRKQAWRDTCGSSFDPVEAATEGSMDNHDVICPICRTPNALPNLLESSKGYQQMSFAVPCTKCNFRFTKDRLAVQKLVMDLVKDHTYAPDVVQYGNEVYLAGSLRTNTSPADVDSAANIKRGIWKLDVCQQALAELEKTDFKSREEKSSALATALLEKLQRSMAVVRTHTAHKFRPTQRKVNRILSAYVDDRPFSVELVSAVLRQGAFVDKMHQFGWTTRDRFKNAGDEVVLNHAIARYHAFLDLMSSSPGELFVPTLDIDLAWHTHQLLSRNYAQECMQYIGRYIDHDDKVEESHLANSFDITCQAWQRQFGVPYTHCGCPMPIPEAGLRGRFAKVLSGLSSKHDTPTLNLVPPDVADAREATHASEHNAVVTGANTGIRGGYPSNERASRRKKLAQWAEEEQKRARKRGEQPTRRNPDHTLAFLSPPPFFAYYNAPAAVCTAPSNDNGYTGPGVSGCVSSPSGTQCGGGCSSSGCGSTSTSGCVSTSTPETHHSHHDSGHSGCSNTGASSGCSNNTSGCSSSTSGCSSNTSNCNSSGCGSSGCSSSNCSGGGGCGGGGGD